MKKASKIMMIVFIIALVVTFIPINNVNAAKKKSTKKVTYTLKKGTLTIKGKGKMPKTIKEIGRYSFYGTGIKKITVPKQVKKIGQDAIGNCKKLKTVTIPGKFKLKVDPNEDYANPVLMSKSSVKTVKFNTDLSIATVSFCEANDLQVMNKDKNFLSIQGIIYTKDGKNLCEFQPKEQILR